MSVGKRLFGRLQLGAFILEKRLLLIDLLLAVQQLLAGGCKLPVGFLSAVLQLLQAVVVALPSVCQFLFAVYQLLPAVFQLLLFFLQCLPRIVKLLARLQTHRLVTLCGQTLRQRGHVRLGSVHGVVVCIGIYLALGLRKRQVDVRVVIQIVRLRQNAEKARQRAVAHGGAAALEVDIQRRIHKANDGERMRFERVQRILVVFLRDGERPAEHRRVVVPSIEHALVRRLRQTAGANVQQIHLLGHAHAAHGHARIVAGRAHHIPPDRALSLRHTGFTAHGFNVAACKAHRAHQAVIIHILRVGIHVQRVHHRCFCQPESAEKAHAQRHNGKNGEKAPERFADLAQCQLQHTPHHSILSTGVGLALRLTDWMVPLLTRITRSAMPVSAELCVMITTVIPFSRLCFCKSCKICFPVL